MFIVNFAWAPLQVVQHREQLAMLQSSIPPLARGGLLGLQF
jgi:hypothetical protein